MTLASPRSAIVRSNFAKLAGGALIAVAALSLAGCETTGAGVAGPAAQAQPAAAPATAPKTAKGPKGPMTHQQAALYCWMSTEHGHADLPLDKRADVVDKCIKQKMQGG